jgi:hypothetical protein
VPREKRGRKGENTVTEEIKTRQTAEETTSAVESGQQAGTGSARYGAERKAMVSWAALLDEAVKKPGFIHEAYSRFHNYSLGNQLLALFQCFVCYVEYATASEGRVPGDTMRKDALWQGGPNGRSP